MHGDSHIVPVMVGDPRCCKDGSDLLLEQEDSAETAAVRAKGEQVGHVTTAEYGSQMLSIGGVRHLTGGSKKEGNVTCDALLKLCSGEPVEVTIDGGHGVVVQAGAPPVVDGRPEERMRVGCGSATIGMFAKQWHGRVDEVVVVSGFAAHRLEERKQIP